MAIRNQYTYTPGYGAASRQMQPPRNVRPSAPPPRAPRRPDVPVAKRRPSGDTAILTLLFIVAPLCGILGAFFSGFLWVFICVTLLVLIGMWVLRCFEPRGRAFLSGVLIVLAAVALIVVIDFSHDDPGYYQPYGGDLTTASGQGGTEALAAQGNSLGLAGLIPDATPTQQPDTLLADGLSPEQSGTGDLSGQNAQGTMAGGYANPGVSTYVSEAQNVLNNYLLMWSQQNYADMVQYTTPLWQSAQNVPQRQLSWNHSGWLLNSWTIEPETQSEAADSATLTVIADLTKNTNKKSSVTNKYSAIVFNIDGKWYVDPDSLRSGFPVVAEPTPNTAGLDETAAQVSADPTTSPTLKLWRNSNGGSFYHLEEKCSTINEKYYKDMVSFTYAELSSSEYSKLRPCTTCNAPKK